MLRVLATPRWVGWTLLAVVVVAGCGGMAYWQLLRAQSPTGSLLNAGYAFQWPLFGLFFAVLWWRMLRQEAQALSALVGDTGDTGDTGDSDDTADAGETAEAAHDGTGGQSPAFGASPFTARPIGVTPGGFDAVPAAGSARAEYNAMLAALAARDRAEQAEQDAGSAGAPTEERTRP